MTPFAELLQQGAGHAWLFIPSAILLGALHGLEPGHSKTMMAAFIVAIRGTVAQAVLLGLSATLSHTAIVWIIALIGLHLGGQIDAEHYEPYFQLASAVIIIGVAVWMLRRTYREHQRELAHEHEHDHHDHGHDESRRIETGHHGIAWLEIDEHEGSPRFRLRFESHEKPAALPLPEEVSVETTRPDGSRALFRFAVKGSSLESIDDIPEPHTFTARLRLSHGHAHDFDVQFEEAADHGHHHDDVALDLTAPGYQDAHELAHANDIKRRFHEKDVTTGQIVMFGLTGGLIPCPASITVLLLCLQLKQVSLGMVLVLCFSIGLALTMVLAGTVAALSMRQASRRWSGFATLARRAPYFSSGLIVLVGLYTAYLGWHGLNAYAH